jgi:hypothetical protein
LYSLQAIQMNQYDKRNERPDQGWEKRGGRC